MELESNNLSLSSCTVDQLSKKVENLESQNQTLKIELDKTNETLAEKNSLLIELPELLQDIADFDSQVLSLTTTNNEFSLKCNQQESTLQALTEELNLKSIQLQQKETQLQLYSVTLASLHKSYTVHMSMFKDFTNQTEKLLNTPIKIIGEVLKSYTEKLQFFTKRNREHEEVLQHAMEKLENHLKFDKVEIDLNCLQYVNQQMVVDPHGPELTLIDMKLQEEEEEASGSGVELKTLVAPPKENPEKVANLNLQNQEMMENMICNYKISNSNSSLKRKYSLVHLDQDQCFGVDSSSILDQLIKCVHKPHLGGGYAFQAEIPTADSKIPNLIIERVGEVITAMELNLTYLDLTISTFRNLIWVQCPLLDSIKIRDDRDSVGGPDDTFWKQKLQEQSQYELQILPNLRKIAFSLNAENFSDEDETDFPFIR